MFIIITLCVITISNNVSYSQMDSVYYFNQDGTQNWWYIQNDVFSFGCVNNAIYNGNCAVNIVEEQLYQANQSRKQNELCFYTTTTNIQRDNEKQAVLNSGQWKYNAPVVTKNAASVNDRTTGEAVRTNDLILVQFVSKNLTSTHINDFIQRNNLEIYWTPPSSLPSATWTYIFRITPEFYSNTFEASRLIFSNEQGFVQTCVPDMNIFEIDACELVDELNLVGLEYNWHIRNEGLNIAGVNAPGTFDADANICECWGEGYHGEGIKVAVIDQQGFDWDHADMLGQYLTGFNCIDLTSITGTAITNLADWEMTGYPQHASTVSSVIAALPNTTITSVGVAYNSKVIPLLVDGFESSIIVGIQQALILGADVVNMSFSSSQNPLDPNNLLSYHVDIQNYYDLGRNGIGGVLVASSGNNNANSKRYPAALPEVIGVGATDPVDKRGALTNLPSSFGWNSIGGSNFYVPVAQDIALPYDVVAPGSTITVGYTWNPNQSSQFYGTVGATGTSFASPIVSGIAAILLSKNPTLTNEQIRQLINSFAYKIPMYNYNAFSDWPGYDKETFYGRVNCLESLLAIDQFLDVEEERVNDFDIIHLNNNEILINLSKSFNSEFQIQVIDITGKVVYNSQIKTDNKQIVLDVESFSNGIYLLSITEKTVTTNILKNLYDYEICVYFNHIDFL